MSDTANEPSSKVIETHITLVHGTFSSPAGWASPKSDFHFFLRTSLPDAFKYHAFKWSGKNSHKARMQAGQELQNFLLEIDVLAERKGRQTRHILVGHSHGGTVCLMSQNNAMRQKNLIGIACFATPFLNFRPSIYLAYWTCMALGAILFLLLVPFVFLPWLDDGVAFIFIFGTINVALWWLASLLAKKALQRTARISAEFDFSSFPPEKLFVCVTQDDEAFRFLDSFRFLEFLEFRASGNWSRALKIYVSLAFSIAASILFFLLQVPAILLSLLVFATFVLFALVRILMLVLQLRFGLDMPFLCFGGYCSRQDIPVSGPVQIFQVKARDVLHAVPPLDNEILPPEWQALEHSNIYDGRHLADAISCWIGGRLASEQR